MMAKRWTWPAVRVAACTCALLTTRGVAAQTSGGPASAGAGGLLGAYSGLMLGMMGSTIPCTQTFHAVRCIQVGAGATAVAAGFSGVLIGSADDERIRRAAVNAGIGAAAGTLVGAAIAHFTQRAGVRDVAALGLIGGAIAAVPRGTGIGFGTGTAVGLLLMGVTDLRFPDAVAISAIGLAAGGLAQWVLDARDARSSAPVSMTPLVAFRVQF